MAVVSTDRGSVRRLWLILASILALVFAVLPHLDLLDLIPILQALLPTAVILTFVAIAVSLIGIASRIAAAKSRYRPRPNWWVPPLILLFAAAIGMAPMLIRPPATVPRTDIAYRSIRVLSLNVQFSGADVYALHDVMAEWAPHIVMFLEVDEGFIDRLAATGALDIMPLRYRTASTADAESGAHGTAILSTWPLSEFGEVPSFGWHLNQLGERVYDYHPPLGFQQPTAVADVPDVGAIQLAAVHPPPPVYSPGAWRGGLRAIGGWVQDSGRTDIPLIIAGDFNASTAHPVFRQAVAGLTNTAVARWHYPQLTWMGRWPQPTWPANSWVPPFTAIDHILVSPSIYAANWHRFSVPGSDHFGVIAELAVPMS